MSKPMKAMLASYGRSVLGAAVALYLAGVTDPEQLVSALVAGLLPVAIRYVNPNDQAFGRVAEEAIKAYLPGGQAVIPKEYLDKNREAIEHLVEAYQKANKEAAAKKAAAKKPAPKK